MGMGLKTVAHLTAMAVLINAVASDTPLAYTNHTVGDTAGWFFNLTTNTSSANYSSWAATQTFNLGDYLIFITDTNQTVIQTNNASTYGSCTVDDSSDSNTFQFNGGSYLVNQALTIPVPLISLGINYFFSNADDGVQCQHGMAFEISVNHGLGLPPSLNQPPPPPYAASPPLSASGLSPVTVESNQPIGAVSKGIANMRWMYILLFCGGALFYP